MAIEGDIEIVGQDDSEVQEAFGAIVNDEKDKDEWGQDATSEDEAAREVASQNE